MLSVSHQLYTISCALLYQSLRAYLVIAGPEISQVRSVGPCMSLSYCYDSVSGVWLGDEPISTDGRSPRARSSEMSESGLWLSAIFLFKLLEIGVYETVQMVRTCCARIKLGCLLLIPLFRFGVTIG